TGVSEQAGRRYRTEGDHNGHDDRGHLPDSSTTRVLARCPAVNSVHDPSSSRSDGAARATRSRYGQLRGASTGNPTVLSWRRGPDADMLPDAVASAVD